MIQSVLNAQMGILEPQLFSPNLLKGTLRKTVLGIPKDIMAPFTFSKDSISLNFTINYVHIYIKD
jgi:hypothetical protein